MVAAAMLALASALGCGSESGTGARLGVGAAAWTAVGPDGGWIRTLAAEAGDRAGLYAGTTGGGVFRSRDRGESWTSLGLTGLDVEAIAVDPTDPAIVYVAGIQGFPAPTLRGVFKSTDAGRTWTSLDAGLPSFGQEISSLAIDPQTPTTLYAGTRYAGVLKSVDAGATWQPSGLIDFSSVVALVVDPATPSTVYAAAMFAGVFKSVDGGATWAAASTGLVNPAFDGLPVLSVHTVILDPRRPDVLYAGTTSSGVYRSTDGAASWEPTTPTGFTEVEALALDARSGALFASAGTQLCDGPACDGGVLKSEDGGATWTAVATGLTDRRVHALLTDPHAPDVVYAGTDRGGVFRSTDAGAHWTASSRGITAQSVLEVRVDPVLPSTAYALGGGTPFQSTDAGATWRPIDAGLETAWTFAFASDGATLWAGTVDRFGSGRPAGLYASRDGGASWQRVAAIDRAVTAIAVDPRAPDVVHVAVAPITIGDDCYLNGEIRQTVDGGATWTTRLVFDHSDEGVLAFAVDPTAPTTVYAAANVAGIFKSVDGGRTWTARSAGLDLECCGPAVVSLAIEPAAPGTIYAGSRRGVFTSADGGASWHPTALENPHDGVYVAALALDPVDGAVYASLAGHVLDPSLGAVKSVFRSADGGASWEDVGRGLPAMGAVALALDPRDGRLYAATAGGSVYTLDAR